MSPDRDEPVEEQEHDQYEDVPPRSIFAATWFRVVLVMIVVGVGGAVAVPYVLDWMNPPPPPRAVARTPVSPLAPTPATPALDRSADDKPPADKRDSTLIPAPLAPTPPTATVPATRPDPKPSPASAAAAPAEPKPAAKTTAPAAKPAPAEKPAPTPVPAPPDAKGKAAAAVTENPAKAPESAAATKPTTARRAAAKATTPAAPAAAGPLWVQVGAFKDEGTAKRLATKLRDDNFKVEQSVKAGGPVPAAKAPATTPGSDQYDVFVTGASVEDLNKRLAGKGLAAETSGQGVVVKPSLPLRDAVALSKDLAVDGFKVQVRRTGGAVTTTPPAPPAEAGGPTLHRVRVGAFPDRPAALAAIRELEAKGYKPFIARGDQ